jgi:zinc protease
MSTVRDREGLTYGINANTDDDTFADGDFYVQATFAPALLEKGIASAKREVGKWYKDGVTGQELADRKINLVGSFQVSLATTDGLATNLLAALERGVGPRWLDEYPAKVNALTPEQVNGAIRKYLDPEKMTLIKAGTVPGAL